MWQAANRSACLVCTPAKLYQGQSSSLCGIVCHRKHICTAVCRQPCHILGLFLNHSKNTFLFIILICAQSYDYKGVTAFLPFFLSINPAIFYAIPVERYYSVEAANKINVWFLAIVAAWRLGLLFYFLKIFTQLKIGNILTITLMPICVIISSLTALNLHHVVFNIMGGVRNPTPHDSSYFVLLFLTGISIVLTAPLLISYGIGIYLRRKNYSK